MMQFLLPALLGAGIGAASNKDNRLKGALIGGGLGAGGGYLAGPGALTGAGLLGSSQAAAPVTDAAFTAGSGGLTTGAGPIAPTGGGLLDSIKQITPYAQAGKTGLEVANMMNPGQQPIQHAQMPAQNPNAPSMAGLFGEIQQAEERRKQEEMQRRMQKRGGFYG